MPFPEPWFPPTNAAWREAEPYEHLPPDERDDFSEPIPCPDCGTEFGAKECDGCGLTLVEIADRLAR